jgi:hypothetical protein
MAITISTDRLNQIKTALGYPTESGDFLLTDTQIKDYCVEPALRQYFSKFPKIVQTEQEIAFSEELIVNYYNSNTFGVVDARITHQAGLGTTGGFNSFVYLASYNEKISKKNFGRVGYNPNSLSQASETAQQVLQSKSGLDKAVRIRIDHVNRQLSAFSNRGGKLLISWALYSDNFADVKYNYIQDVIELSQGHLLIHASRTLGIFQNTNIPVSINADFLNSEGDKLITKITEKWNEIGGVLLMKI